ncbi:hypothetical protein [Parvularcula sp. LCG005]|uniref:hypothetical protein n=1 Tax=Parvularcula sp. LCG005 TaxID=3078805 RepID=UPI0029421A9C|nr:hypothetical protein [Parvularcula sp. LCG005]WOI52038.1 hypothetical protein RUI03_07695 [Parvularcula sp. LCG005]
MKPKLILISLLASLFVLPGCVAVSAARLTGDVVEGAANVTIGTVKTTGKVAGAVLPGGGDKDEKENKKKR